MPPAPPEPESPPTGPKTCTCGYDLTGLPTDGDAKCPECGAVVADLPPFPPWYRKVWVWLAVTIVPSAVIYPVLLTLWVLPVRADLLAIAGVHFYIMSVWNWAVISTALFVFGRARKQVLQSYRGRLLFGLAFAPWFVGLFALIGYASLFAAWLMY
jgi:hypothetical protein